MPTCKCGEQVDYVKTTIAKKVMTVQGAPVTVLENVLGRTVIVTNAGAIRRGDVVDPKAPATQERARDEQVSTGRTVHECWATRLGRSS